MSSDVFPSQIQPPRPKEIASNYWNLYHPVKTHFLNILLSLSKVLIFIINIFLEVLSVEESACMVKGY